ncbi:DUF559 domain-containing protein [Mycobacterium sp. B14F4]|uniref:DUF559 domain-containing protein n=1 Tax=Mycobacterium sp. B14F4 TaxID=3153565 RepID=UPI00325E5222
MGELDRPFIGTEARAAGRVSKRALRRDYDMLYRNVYAPKDFEMTAAARAVAAWLWSGRAATVAGLSAAALHGSRWVDADAPAELIRAEAVTADGIVVHRATLADDEVCRVKGISTSTPARTAFDLGRRGQVVRAVVHVDALARATDLKPADIEAVAHRHRGARGSVQLRAVLRLMDGGAESPQESRTRLLLVAAGFPPPTTQLVVCDRFGRFIARLDMGWPQWKVAVEYDGPQHWTDPAQRARDIDRLAELAAEGWIIVRVSRDLLRYRPAVVLARVLDAMRTAGRPDNGNVRLDARVAQLNARRVWT